MKTLPNHTALKEWSTVIDALARGEQVILIRKGGIADPSFAIEAERFYLYPTYFHQGEADPRSSVEIAQWCEVVRTWTVADRAELERLAALVALPPETLEARYRFRPDQALYLVGVRTWILAAPTVIAYQEEYGGCRSWISIDDEIDIEGSRPVLAETALERRLDAVASRLAVRLPVA